MGRTEANNASAYLRAGQPKEATTALENYWRLQHLTEDQVASLIYPRYSGDIILLA
ncbi:hypothetical protein AOQ84DRAFT_160061 [Glonium stellatum]|uniref:Uncharacterized protein n=1 Tax=Glonium stellatum TaxID=574774 RepID=A0A8E2ER79_9PEZI|nr:hypothetical protein AOQ84DRAFT_160061 [Glonium stellatum]